MSVPAKRRPKSEGRRRRAHHALKKKNLSVCPKCKKPVLPHRACGFCGYYKGREVLKMQTKKSEGKKEGKKNK
jgi:large subunit ribosomal protein L32